MKEERCPRCGRVDCMMIGGQSHKNCPSCGTETCFNELYDATFCSKCNKWLEHDCEDPFCDYCKYRPEKPLFDKKITYQNFAERLIEEVPDLKGIYEEHIKDNDEIINHVFMNDVYCHIEKTIDKKIPPYMKSLINFLDKAIVCGDEMVENLVAVSFLENLITTKKHSEKIIVSFLSLTLIEELRKMREWKPTNEVRK